MIICFACCSFHACVLLCSEYFSSFLLWFDSFLFFFFETFLVCFAIMLLQFIMGGKKLD